MTNLLLRVMGFFKGTFKPGEQARLKRGYLTLLIFMGVLTLIIIFSDAVRVPIQTVLVGLVPSVSLESGKRVAESAYLSLVEIFSLADRRSPAKQVTALLSASPDMILIVGGTDGGAVETMRKQIDTLSIGCALFEPDNKPTAIYAGNQDLQGEVTEKLQEEVGVEVLVTDNVRPTLDMERVDRVQAELAGLYYRQRARSTMGIGDVGGWADGGVVPTAHGFSRLIRVLGNLWGQDVLGIDLGSTATTVAAFINKQHYLNVFGQLGIGHSARGALEQIRPEAVARWLSFEQANEDEVPDAILNRWLYPQTVPVNQAELEIVYALARELIRTAVVNARSTWREVGQRGLLPHFDTVLLSGSTLSKPPHYGWSVLAALDALLPTGMTRLLLDPYGMASALGALAPVSPQAVVQVLDAGAFIDLGAVISVSGRARRGEIVLRGLIDDGKEPVSFEVPYGTVTSLPLAYGVEAELLLRPRRVSVNVKQKRLKIKGGEMGVIVDARGRPWRFPREAGERREMLRDWQKKITMSQELVL